jgi:dihydroorotate dehydrogenase (NAD+) catalytic subunit
MEFLLAGASAVAVGTSLYADPAAANRVLEGIVTYLEQRGLGKLSEIVGAAVEK